MASLFDALSQCGTRETGLDAHRAGILDGNGLTFLLKHSHYTVECHCYYYYYFRPIKYWINCHDTPDIISPYTMCLGTEVEKHCFTSPL